MIAVDTSALMAIARGEAEAGACIAVLAAEARVIASAATIAEALVVAKPRGVEPEMLALVDRFGLEVLPVTDATARQVAAAYARWGRGFHPAGLNFGDCFAYVAAMEHGCPLLYVGNDFAKTDVPSAL